MNDEKYVFIQDSKEKAITARSARKRRTHNGKGGSVKFPSDYLSRKELNAMNGEVKSYKLNDPMTWKEFNALPLDVQKIYISALRQKYSVSVGALADMFGVHRTNVSRMLTKLNMSFTRGRHKWDEEGFAAWCNGGKTEETEPAEEVVTDVPVEVKEVSRTAIPCSGKLEFECPADQALNTVAQILGNRVVNILISWDSAEVKDNG
jgi:hypothetical protein